MGKEQAPAPPAKASTLGWTNVHSPVRQVLAGRRWGINHVHKLAMYLVKRLCDLTLQETATHFGVESHGGVGWPAAQVGAKEGDRDQSFKNRLEQVEAEIGQQKICPLFEFN